MGLGHEDGVAVEQFEFVVEVGVVVAVDAVVVHVLGEFFEGEGFVFVAGLGGQAGEVVDGADASYE